MSVLIFKYIDLVGNNIFDLFFFKKFFNKLFSLEEIFVERNNILDVLLFVDFVSIKIKVFDLDDNYIIDLFSFINNKMFNL